MYVQSAVIVMKIEHHNLNIQLCHKVATNKSVISVRLKETPSLIRKNVTHETKYCVNVEQVNCNKTSSIRTLEK